LIPGVAVLDLCTNDSNGKRARHIPLHITLSTMLACAASGIHVQGNIAEQEIMLKKPVDGKGALKSRGHRRHQLLLRCLRRQ